MESFVKDDFEFGILGFIWIWINGMFWIWIKDKKYRFNVIFKSIEKVIKFVSFLNHYSIQFIIFKVLFIKSDFNFKMLLKFFPAKLALIFKKILN